MTRDALYFPVLSRRSSYTVRKKYSDYRSEIREDCKFRCVYCDSHENVLGGTESMQLDHFHPQALFPKEIHDPQNLLWVCGRCNCLKRADWHDFDPTNVHSSKFGYLDPFKVDRRKFFQVGSDGTIKPISDPAEYMIQRLKLNRSFLIYVRRSRKRLYELRDRVEKYFDDDIAEYEFRYKQGEISKAKFDGKVKRASNMKEILLELLDEMSTI